MDSRAALCRLCATRLLWLILCANNAVDSFIGAWCRRKIGHDRNSSLDRIIWLNEQLGLLQQDL